MKEITSDSSRGPINKPFPSGENRYFVNGKFVCFSTFPKEDLFCHYIAEQILDKDHN